MSNTFASRRKAIILLIGMLMIGQMVLAFITPWSAVYASAPVTSSVEVSSSAIRAGEPIGLSILAKSAEAKKLIFQLQVVNTGGAVVFSKQLDDQELPAGQATSYKVSWTTPTDLPSGAYSISLGVFGAGWTEMYSWDWGLATFRVQAGGAGGGGEGEAPQFTSSGTATSSVEAGETAAVTATLTSDKAVTSTVTFTVYNSSGSAVYSEKSASLTFEASRAKVIAAAWNVPKETAAGVYTVQAAVTDTSEKVTYHRNANLTTIVVKAPDEAAGAAYTTQAIVSEHNVNAGGEAKFVARIGSNKDVSVLADVVITNPYTGKAVYQQVYSQQQLSAASVKDIALTWQVPNDAPTGTYPIAIGIFGNSWEGPYYWNSNAGYLNVNDGSTPQVTFQSAAEVSNPTVKAGTNQTFQITAASDLNIKALLNVTVTDPQGAVVLSKDFAGETFAIGQSRNFQVNWPVPANAGLGTYFVQIGIYNADRSQTYHLHHEAVSFSVTKPDVQIPPDDYPDNGANASWTTKVNVKEAMEAGYTDTFTVDVGSSDYAKALIDVEIYADNGKVEQFVFDNQWFKPGETKHIPITWNIPAWMPRGDYKVKVGVFPAGWGTAWKNHWNDQAGSFRITWGTIPEMTVTGSAAYGQVTPGQEQALNAELISTETVPATVSLELYDPAGNRVGAQTFADAAFTKGVPSSFSLKWTPSASAVNGSYKLKVSVAKPDGVRIYYTNASAAQFDVTGGVDLAYTISASTKQNEVRAGQTLNVNAQVTSTAPSNVSVKVSFVDVLTGRTVHTESLANQTVSANQGAALSINWSLPKWINMNAQSIRTKEDVVQFVLDGDYKVNVELYNGDMTYMIAKKEGAASFKVVNPADPVAPAPDEQPTLPNIMKLGVFATNNDEYGVTGWMEETAAQGARWNFAYRYLNGGVNNADGWTNWDPYNVGDWEGAYAYDYAKDATDRGFTPVFTFYQMLQSISADCLNCDETKDDIVTLNDPYAMRSYFEEFKLLMQLIGTGNYNGRQGIGKTIVVHVDPDLAGYAEQAVLDNSRCYGQCSGQGNDPALLNAAVSSTRMRELEGLPNTYQGYNWALLKLRDMYAPNVLMAPHVNSWGTLQDVGKITDPTIDVAALGKLAGQFASLSGVKTVPAGIKPYDFIFNDVDDQDAAGTYSKDWLDRTNLTLPNFHNWEKFLKAAVDETGKKAMVWQIPVGNQVYRTVNNTPGHWQDNKAEYMFSHMQELVDTGIVGLMFGHGQPDSTAHYNKLKDKDANGNEIVIFNPEPLTFSDGWGDGSVHTNDKVAIYSDDDGGYLREQAIEYYKNPIPVQNR